MKAWKAAGEEATLTNDALRLDLEVATARLEDAMDLIAKLKGRVDALQSANRELAIREATAADNLATATDRGSAAETLAKALDDRAAALNKKLLAAAQTLTDAKFKRNQQIKALKKTLADRDRRLAEAERATADGHGRVTEAQQTISELKAALEGAMRQHGELLDSASWRMTSPLRWVVRKASSAPKARE